MKKALKSIKNEQLVVGKIRSLVTILQAVAIFIGGQFMGALLVSSIGMGAGISADRISDAIANNDIVRFLLILSIESFTVWFIYLFLRRYKKTFATIGLTRRPKAKYVIEALRGYAIYFVIFLAAISLVGALGAIDTNQAQQLGFSNPSGYKLILAFLSLVMLPPIGEELLFRGFLYQRLRSTAGLYAAALVTSILFAMAHLEFGSGAPLNWAAALDTFILSCVLIHITNRTKSLWPAIFLHTLKNCIAFATLFVLK